MSTATSSSMRIIGSSLLLLGAQAAAQGQNPSAPPSLSATFGPPVTFATHAELASYGFQWGPSDGQFGAIPQGSGNYTFYGTAGSSPKCVGSPSTNGAFTFTGTLDHISGSNGCKLLFGPGSGPAGWIFDKNYAGGGQVVKFAGGGKSGYLMAFHGEYQWPNPAEADRLCQKVPCFYSGLGLAVSTDNGKTFQDVGQIFQPVQPLSVFMGSGNNYDVGYGSLVVADANGQHLDNPPPDPTTAYFYLIFRDWAPSLPGVCAYANCLGVARAKYSDVVAAALSGDPHQVATVFHKYDGASPDPWTQPSTSNTPDLSGASGKFAPLWTDQGLASTETVIYDSAFNVYVIAIQGWMEGVWIRVSSDLLHWSEPIAFYSEPGRDLWYPNLIGETGDPTIGGPAPRVYFSSFPSGGFPDYSTAVLESVPVMLAARSPSSALPPFLRPETPANGAIYTPGSGLVPGSWAQVQGFNLSTVTRKWAATDFSGLGNNLPTNLSGTQLTVNGIPAAVYYVQPDQVNFQVPAGVSGNVSVQVTTNGVTSNMATGSVAANAPGIFPIIQQGNTYPAAVFLDGKLAGDPAVEPYFRKAHPGDILQLFATGLVASQAGVVPSPQSITGVTVTIGSVVVTPSSATLVGVGLFQINFTVPQQFATLAEGVYPISIQVNRVSSPADVASNTALQIVLPIQH
jgi:uncharacterized protein (TIGR03437 family)